MNNDPSALAIVKAITQIGSSISLDVLVEGIENTEQLDTLINCDCQIGQGFIFTDLCRGLQHSNCYNRQLNFLFNHLTRLDCANS